MKLRLPNRPSTSLLRRGFTMIEIAIALGVIGFALVAIMGILPLGLTVQRDNRFETIINQDATYWLEVIRDGARETSFDPYELTNYVERIIVTNVSLQTYTTYVAVGTPPLDYSSNIVGILTRPFDTNVFAYADVRAFSGSAGEKRSDVSFTYRMQVRLVPIDPATGDTLQAPAAPALWEMRLIMSWPVVAGGNPPTARKPLLYRTMASRNVLTNVWGSETNYWFAP